MKRDRKKKRGRPRKIRKSSKAILKEAKRITGKGKHRDFVHLTCITCNEECRIHVNSKEPYTKEIRKNYICLMCRPSKRRR